ncbi:hypothetical protein K435DRAFT_845122 [Dendrothele bispora CBS 962.96]|uniref:Uncharacterized protein n=1 Tax=Dendrothele bispora (strain CBS 962.96) TaxID=1314807 RepID=A0A4S8KX30_DENBC|nr:hypothetical protein K435DRAFT_845122 [Dendrothele bispora CBS 962.96]
MDAVNGFPEKSQVVNSSCTCEVDSEDVEIGREESSDPLGTSDDESIPRGKAGSPLFDPILGDRHKNSTTFQKASLYKKPGHHTIHIWTIFPSLGFTPAKSYHILIKKPFSYFIGCFLRSITAPVQKAHDDGNHYSNVRVVVSIIKLTRRPISRELAPKRPLVQLRQKAEAEGSA